MSISQRLLLGCYLLICAATGYAAQEGTIDIKLMQPTQVQIRVVKYNERSVLSDLLYYVGIQSRRPWRETFEIRGTMRSVSDLRLKMARQLGLAGDIQLYAAEGRLDDASSLAELGNFTNSSRELFVCYGNQTIDSLQHLALATALAEMDT